MSELPILWKIISGGVWVLTCGLGYWVNSLIGRIKELEQTDKSTQQQIFKIGERITILESTSVHRDHLSDTMKEFKEEISSEMVKMEHRQEKQIDELKDVLQKNMSNIQSEIQNLLTIMNK